MPNHMTPEEMVPYIDIEAGLGRVRGNQALYKRMLGLFTRSEELAAFEEALDKQDIARAAELAHGIKGMAGNLGLDRVFALSNELMVQLRQGIADAQLIADYRDAVEKTIEEIGEATALMG